MNPMIYAGIPDKDKRSFLFDVKKHVYSNSFTIVETVKQAVSNEFGISIQQLESSSRLREVAEARMIAMKLIRENTSLSLKTIGKEFGNRDHSTVIYACETVNDLKQFNKIYNEKYLSILKLVKGMYKLK